jgi:hypothetical protein
MEKLEKSWLSEQDIINRVAEVKGIKLSSPIEGSIYVYSGTIMSLPLTKKVIADLEEAGFKFLPPEREQDKYLIEFKLREGRYCWRLKPEEQLELTFNIFKHPARNEDGVHLIPTIGNLNDGSTDDYIPGLKAFRIAFKNFKENAHPLVRDLIKNNKNDLVVSWAELNLEGLMSISQLWSEFEKGGPSRKYLKRLPFIKPNPELACTLETFKLPQFVPKKAQLEILTAWERQLSKFQSEL